MKYSNLPDMKKHMKIHSRKQAISSEGNPLKKRRRSVKQLNENLSVADLLNEEDESIDESAVKDTIDIEAVPGYSKFGCAFCVSEFRTEEELGTHEKNNHEIKCGECNYLSVTKDDLSRHKDIEHNTKVRCEYCGSEYEFEQELEFHIRDAHTKIEYSCDKCGFKTQLIESIAEHSNLCDKKKLEVPMPKIGEKACGFCGKTFETDAGLSDHMSLSHTLKCNNCEQEFSEKELLIEHVNAQHRVVAFTCEVCSFLCANDEDLITHMQAEHRVPVTYTCETCGLVFSDETKLGEHSNEHHLAVRYTCKFCGHTFDDIIQLQDHIIVHHHHPGGYQERKAIYDMLIEFKTSTQITLQNMIENQVKLGNEIMIVKSAKCDNDKIDKIIKSVDELTIEVKGERKKDDVNRNAKDDSTRMKNDDQPKTKTNQQKRIKNKDKLLHLKDYLLVEILHFHQLKRKLDVSLKLLQLTVAQEMKRQSILRST